MTQPLEKLLEKAKQNIDVIDFRKEINKDEYYASFFRDNSERPKRTRRISPSEVIKTFVPTPPHNNDDQRETDQLKGE